MSRANSTFRFGSITLPLLSVLSYLHKSRIYTVQHLSLFNALLSVTTAGLYNNYNFDLNRYFRIASLNTHLEGNDKMKIIF